MEGTFNQPAAQWTCDCGTLVERWRGQSDVQCYNCGQWYNAFGQRLVSNWASAARMAEYGEVWDEDY